MDPTGIEAGNVVRLRKRHPCGGDTWEVIRIGTDIGLCCQTCGRYVLLRRALFRQRLKAVLSPEGAPSPERSAR